MITDTGLSHLRQSLKRLTLLQNLSFDFSRLENAIKSFVIFSERNCKITDAGLDYLRQILQDHASLTKVSLKFFK